MVGFVGRREQLCLLDRELDLVRRGDRDRPGRALLVRGRRRIGKSRLVEEFVERAGVPHVWFTASMQPSGVELRSFTDEVVASDLPGASTLRGVTPDTWEAGLRLLAGALPTDAPSVVVIDELPYLIDADGAFEGTLQKVFDRVLSRLPVLLVGVGPDQPTMESLNTCGRPHQRAREMIVPPLSPLEVAGMTGAGAADAVDAWSITGGLPLVCAEWPHGASTWQYLEEALASPTSALLVSAERSLAAEFPTATQARLVLSTIGAGERTFTAIGQKAGGLQQASLARSLAALQDKRVVAADTPLSTRPSRETRYRVADPYLRFWLTFLGPSFPEIERGRSDRVLARIQRSWTSWRGRAVEPIVRESLTRLPPEQRAGTNGVVGGWWNRTNETEIDLVVADRAPVADRIEAVGSIKWLEASPFDDRDLARLVVHRDRVPGAGDTTPLLAVTRSGCTASGVHVVDPGTLLEAWR